MDATIISVSLINALSAALMLIPILIGEALPGVVAIASPQMYFLVSFLLTLIAMIIGLVAAVGFAWGFSVRMALIFILTIMGQVMFGFYISPLDGIATGLVKRLFTTIIFAFFMIIGLAAFLALVGSIYAMSIHPIIALMLLLAAFATLGKLKDLISDLINEKGSYDGASWKTVPSALILTKANKMQNKYMGSRKNNNSSDSSNNNSSGGNGKTSRANGMKSTGGGTTLVTKGGSEKSSTPIKSATKSTKTRFNPSSKI
jgi:hypothetical protein